MIHELLLTLTFSIFNAMKIFAELREGVDCLDLKHNQLIRVN